MSPSARAKWGGDETRVSSAARHNLNVIAGVSIANAVFLVGFRLLRSKISRARWQGCSLVPVLYVVHLMRHSARLTQNERDKRAQTLHRRLARAAAVEQETQLLLSFSQEVTTLVSVLNLLQACAQNDQARL